MILSISDVDLSGKRVLIRVDINSPVVDGKIIDNPRIKEHAQTIKELMNKKAKVIILAHQGRPGDKDFTNLEKHAELLSKHIEKEIKFVDDIYGEKAVNEIRKLKDGEAILLDNVRMMKDEMLKIDSEKFTKTDFVKTLAKEADIFINDAFSVSHRSQASVVGFTFLLPSYVGSVMEKELNAFKKIENPERPLTFIIGGAKPEEKIKLLEKDFDHALLGGEMSKLFLATKGYDFGKMDEELLAEAKKLFKNKKIILPQDFAIDVNGERKEITLDELPTEYEIADIGTKTIEEYKEIIKESKTVMFSGTMGVTEKKYFDKGTDEILRFIADSDVYSIVIGGHSRDFLEKTGLDKKISFTSLAGGAIILALIGEKLPGIEALERAKK